jgi:hypothetical protein
MFAPSGSVPPPGPPIVPKQNVPQQVPNPPQELNLRQEPNLPQGPNLPQEPDLPQESNLPQEPTAPALQRPPAHATRRHGAVVPEPEAHLEPRGTSFGGKDEEAVIESNPRLLEDPSGRVCKFLNFQ